MKTNDQIANWAMDLQSLAQAGLRYGHDVFDRERYEEIRRIAGEMMAARTGIPEEKIYVINNFVEDSVFYPLKDTQKKEEINVCFSGALCYKKGIDILKSLTQYIENHDLPRKIKFNIATNFDRNTEDFKNLKKITLQTGLISSQMPDFYRKNDIKCLPHNLLLL